MIAILNYGLGNIRAFANIYHDLGIPHQVVEDAASLRKASRIIVPGVGAFDHAMERLQAAGLAEPLREMAIERAVPLLGVCVGMQMLARGSDEGRAKGLGWIAGHVRRIRFSAPNARGVLPHLGWNTVVASKDEPLFRGLGEEPEFYFLHSYYFEADHAENVAATTRYGSSLPCAVRSANIHGVQFHPEKSHQNGIQLLKNFAEI